MFLKRLISKIRSEFSASKNAYILFIIVLIVNLVQSVFTDLLNDEPYYYVYSQYLNWGYFDHPPLIAFLIEFGKFIPGELGVRFFCAIWGSFTFFFIYKLIELESPPPPIYQLTTSFT
ncbi:MAG: hypothetical protein EAZ64_00010 [Sphingobacteriales bacterium]|nr:MAG: hypothetical protein EAZ64_00010 [Sphingobacteriales bacterium]